MGRRFRYEYGAGPLHLAAVVATFALAGWALVEIFDTVRAADVAIWLGGAVVAHDLVLLPLYSLVARIGQRFLIPRTSALNYVRVPAVLSGFLFLVWFPEILGLADPRFMNDVGRSTSGYLSRWLLLTAAMFVISAVAFGVRVRRERRR